MNIPINTNPFYFYLNDDDKSLILPPPDSRRRIQGVRKKSTPL